jgi:hypothetical protein
MENITSSSPVLNVENTTSSTLVQTPLPNAENITSSSLVQISLSDTENVTSVSPLEIPPPDTNTPNGVPVTDEDIDVPSALPFDLSRAIP